MAVAVTVVDFRVVRKIRKNLSACAGANRRVIDFRNSPMPLRP